MSFTIALLCLLYLFSIKPCTHSHYPCMCTHILLFDYSTTHSTILSFYCFNPLHNLYTFFVFLHLQPMLFYSGCLPGLFKGGLRISYQGSLKYRKKGSVISSSSCVFLFSSRHVHRYIHESGRYSCAVYVKNLRMPTFWKNFVSITIRPARLCYQIFQKSSECRKIGQHCQRLAEIYKKSKIQYF
jgi:hypothetical protein